MTGEKKTDIERLEEFLNAAKSKRYFSEETIVSTFKPPLKMVKEFLAEVGEEQTVEYAKNNLEGIFSRIARKPDSPAKETLQTYKQRFLRLINEFKKWDEDPAKYSGPTSRAREKKTEKDTAKKEVQRSPVEPISSTLEKQVVEKQGDFNININIQLQLPATENSEIYDKLFEAMKKHLLSR